MKEIIELICRENEAARGLSSEFISNSVKRRMTEIQVNDLLDYQQILLDNNDEMDQVVTLLSVSWSSFFRESLTFCILEKEIIPAIIEAKKNGEEIRVWSVGCAAGQEPYSIAILLNELLEKSKKEIGVRIFATDISENVLLKAEKGLYRKDEIINLRLEYIEKYFQANGDAFSVIPKIKEQVDFSNHNILDKDTLNPPNSIFGRFDIIFCRNLLIYYNKEVQRYIIDKLKKAIRENGYLITGEAEMSAVEKISGYVRCSIETAVLKENNAKNA